jgi:protein-S-isoprenylcysteine O-methyltransferase Ste14
MKPLVLALRTLLFATAFILFWSWVALQFRRFDPQWSIALPEWSRGLGVVVGLLGGLLGILCVATFALRGHGTPAPFDPPREFVAVGIYRYVRNPMYLGGLAMLAG